jgi:hypothetical protein
MGSVELVLRSEGSFQRWSARKRLHAQYRNDPTFRAMFMDEARLQGLVRHQAPRSSPGDRCGRRGAARAGCSPRW